ncbi:thyroid receptor-interacting protein 11 isoform X2 [Eleutherodactylus coqui]|uniref:thyroid receptor-interacting protein 11 isoform X2 n=1 Tax=Eleutherodactylus coqui TaxID=57060 RepID=UPI0034622414
MASWFGGLGSGLGQSLGQVGGSLSNLTGQISSFTKDMLLEGAEELPEGSPALHVTRDIESIQALQRSENERLKKVCSELEDKLEAAELQVKQQSVDYRNRLQQREVEISHLKAKLNSLQDELQKSQISTQLSSVSLQAADSSAFMSSIQPPHASFQGDDMDFGDVIWSQQEINTLSSEVSRLKAEVSHWKHVAQSSKNQGTPSADTSGICILQNTIKDLKQKLSQEIDDHQHELSVLQDAHRQKLAEITRRHREELGEYEERIEELEEQLNTGAAEGTSDNSKVFELQKTILSLEAENAESIQKVQQLEMKANELNSLASSLEEEKSVLCMEKELAVNERNSLSLDYEKLISEFTKLGKTGDAGDVHNLKHEVLRLQEALFDAEKEMSRMSQSEQADGDSVPEGKVAIELENRRLFLEEELKRMEKEKDALRTELDFVLSESAKESDLKQLRRDLEEKERMLQETMAEKETLTTELDELDKQNQETMQHLILMKEQLSKQKIEAESQIAHLTMQMQTEKEKMISENSRLLQELEFENENHSELQTSKRQLEVQVNEKLERLKQLEAVNADLIMESKELKETLNQVKQELATAREDLEARHENQNDSEKETTIVKLQNQLSEVKQMKDELEKEICDLRMENEMLLSTQEKAKQELQEVAAQSSKDSLEKQTLIEALRMEKGRLELELNQMETRLLEQAQEYERTIKELSNAQKLDTTTLQREHERLIKLNQEKEFQIAEGKRSLEQMEIDCEETKEMLTSSLEGQKQLTDMIREKETFIEELKEKTLEMQRELNLHRQASIECDVLKQTIEEKEKMLASMKEDNSHLKEEIERLKDQQSRPQPVVEPKTLDIITELEAEITQLTKVRSNYEEELKLQKKVVEKHNQSTLQFQKTLQDKIKETDEIKLQHKEMVDTYENLLSEKDSEISSLRQTNELISSQLQNEHLIHTDSSVIFHDTKTQNINNSDNGTEKHDLSKVEVEQLVKGIKEKEMEIKMLNEKNITLTKQIDQLSKDEVGKLTQIIQQKDLEIQNLHARVTAVNYMQDVVYLQQQIQAYAMEREQVLAVLSEKTRENSQLRTEYHKMMDVVAAKESALLKLQEENQRLSRSQEGSTQDMFRETIQNLSRIIREKDIEIDALSQKCQTLLTVLQASSSENGNEMGSVNSNQFEELLQERDKLKQQVKKMEEWKQQVMTTVQNMQHESAHLQEELHKLQGQISLDSDSNTRLQVDYNNLIQSYERNEKKLNGLGVELSNVQSSIGELNNTKEQILGQLDTVKLQAGNSATMTDIDRPLAASSELKDDHMARVLQECEQLKTQMQQKDSTIKTLQENNQRLSDSIAVTSEEGRRSQEGAILELMQVKERSEVLHKSLKEKDILIKTKGDKLNSATETLRNKENENQLLKQAVTNLKERTLILEMDINKLKEENEKVMAKEKEKESEFRALHETNMQFSMLLREKEFESNSMKEKASALENLLKEKEQGKAGELNHLLNEVKSMQEKAVLFQHERDQVMLALKQKQMESVALQNEVQHLREKGQRLNQELERLRNHLLEMEDSYTREALAAEDRETELKKKVSVLEEKLLFSSSAVETASHQASIQVESLQEQLNLVTRQRDEALLQFNMSQEQVKQYALSLSNLQMVLEQFQQEEKAMYTAELERHKKQNAEFRLKVERMEDKIVSLQESLDEANGALEAASRLTEQLDLKEEQIEELKRQGDLKQEMLDDSQNKLMSLLNSTEGKVDKLLMRNLFVGHFHTPKNKRHEVLRLMGSILGLNKVEMDELLLEENHGMTRWVTGWFGGAAVHSKSVPGTPLRPTQSLLNRSFSELFVKFLETESLPKLPPLKLTMQDMAPLGAATSGSQSTTAFPPGSGPSRRQESNPFLAPRSAAIPLITSSGTSGHLLMKPISEALPTFTPMPVSSDASAGAVLKDLLKQ